MLQTWYLRHLLLIGYTLSSPATFLAMGSAGIYLRGVHVLSNIKHKSSGEIAMGSFMVLCHYIVVPAL